MAMINRFFGEVPDISIVCIAGGLGLLSKEGEHGNVRHRQSVPEKPSSNLRQCL
jgi:hypothetical protein